MKKTVAGIMLIFLVIAGYVIFSKNKNEKSKTDIPQSAVQRYVAAEGKVEAMPGFEVEIGSEIDGRIAEFFVDEGDEVKKGQLIATLENKDILARLKESEAELAVERARLKEVASGAREEEIKKADAALASALADMEFAKTSLNRHKELIDEGLVPIALYDEKVAGFKVSEARVREAEEEKRLLEKGPKPETLQFHEDSVRRAMANVEYFKSLLGKTSITSPIPGKVIRKYLQKGEMISKEMLISLAAVADIEKVWINAEVDETDSGRIRVGYPAEVTSEAYPGKIFKGEVREISEYVGPRNVKPNDPAKNVDMKVIQVKIATTEKTPFRLGMTVDVRIIRQESGGDERIRTAE
ncbi:MAG: HlyD family efflux transporter periplasmic adaptor subunit [Nitrospiraceae bacterium]|nr:MAG: HlyD family efflux transporter periplasmic adaptor subunit [Nitrospiraceae bacterium]